MIAKLKITYKVSEQSPQGLNCTYSNPTDIAVWFDLLVRIMAEILVAVEITTVGRHTEEGGR